MLLIHDLRTNRDQMLARLNRRGTDYTYEVDMLLRTDTNLRDMQKQLEETQAYINKTSREIGALIKAGKRDHVDTHRLQDTVAQAKNVLGTLPDELKDAESSLRHQLLQLPNSLNNVVPDGTSATDNEEIAVWGFPKSTPLPHWELVKTHKLVDFELGNKVSGAGFPVYTGFGAKLQRALINFFLDRAIAAGYTEYQVPLLVNQASVTATGQFPDKDGQMYHDAKDNLFLIPTAEVPLTNLYRDTIVPVAELPIKLTGYTPCFRREAGSYGAEVRGLNRLHQFDKIEIVQIVEPADCVRAHEEMLSYVGGLLRALQLPYRELRLCAGDTGFTSALTHDFEVYSSGQDKWLEVSSVSMFETYQTNRLKLRYKDVDGKNKLAHTLNGSALALPRIVAALLEQCQPQGDAAVFSFPVALQPYLR